MIEGCISKVHLAAELQRGAGHLGCAQLDERVAPLAVHGHVDDGGHAGHHLRREGGRHGAVEQLPQRVLCHHPARQVPDVHLRAGQGSGAQAR